MQEAMEKALAKKKVFLLDMDGTIYLDETPIGDMIRTLQVMRDKGKRIVYLTNNSSKSEKAYVEKLKRIGFYDERDLVYTSSMATIEYLQAHFEGKRVYLVANDCVKEEFLAAGIFLVEKDPEVVVLAYDTHIDFQKFSALNEAIVNGAFYIATHPDAVCPAKGVFPPDVGSFIALLKCSSGKEPDLICGKPGTVMGGCIKGRLGVSADEVVMVGDRLHTDIRFGNQNGFATLLVLSGETTEKMLASSPDRPTFILPSLNEILPYLE